MNPPKAPIRVTVLSGFLGSGKTTLMNHLLAGLDASRVAIIENELGEISIDHQLVLRTDLGSLETIHGRTCCSAREELLDLLRNLAHSGGNQERLFIETTGVAHPGMVAHAILGDVFLKDSMVLDGVVTVVDAKNLLAHLGRDGHADEQIAYADVIVINKIDLVTEAELARVVDAVSSINGSCKRIFAKDATVEPEELLNIGGYDMKRIANGVGGCDEGHAAASPAAEIPGMPSLKRLSRHEIGTISVDLEGDLDADLFCRWMEAFIQENQGSLYRGKGILSLRNVPERMILQGVHGLFQITLGQPWNKSPRHSQLVFIGKKIQRETILAALEACRPPAN